MQLVHAVWAAWCCKGPCILQFCPGSADHHNWGVWSGISQHMSWPFSSWNLQSSTGMIPQDVTEEQVMADPRLYVSGREGPKMNDDSEILLWDLICIDMPWCVNARVCKGSKKLNVKLDKLKKNVCFPQSGLLFVKHFLRLGSQCYEVGQGANGFKQTCWLRDFRNGWLIWEAALAALAALAEIEMLLSAAVHSCVIGFAGSPDCGVDGMVWEVS